MKTLSASEQAEHSVHVPRGYVHHASLPFEMRKDTSFWVQEVCGEMQTSAGPFLPCHPAPMLPQGPSYLQAISTHEFPIWFSHDVLYIIARATFQRKVLHRNKNSNCCAATHAARDQRQGQLDLKCAQLMPPNHSLLVGSCAASAATACADRRHLLCPVRGTQSTPRWLSAVPPSAVPTQRWACQVCRFESFDVCVRGILICCCRQWPSSLIRLRQLKHCDEREASGANFVVRVEVEPGLSDSVDRMGCPVASGELSQQRARSCHNSL